MATRQRDKPRKGSNGSGTSGNRKDRKYGSDGYIDSVSTSTRSLIDDWEADIVTH